MANYTVHWPDKYYNRILLFICTSIIDSYHCNFEPRVDKQKSVDTGDIFLAIKVIQQCPTEVASGSYVRHIQKREINLLKKE